MNKVYACLAGTWVCLNDDPECCITETGQSPSLWWKEGAPICSPGKTNADSEHSLYDLDYVNIFYESKTYRICPIFIQIVNE